MKVIRFVSSGLLGDFIHGLSAIKNICWKENALADIYVTSGYWGDVWRYGSERAYNDLYEILKKQSYVNEVYHLEGEMQGEFININDWRKSVATTHAETGKYDKCWSELLSETFGYKILGDYKWVEMIEIDANTFYATVIHRSKHRHNSNFDWEKHLQGVCVFVTTDKAEWDIFPYKEKCMLHLVSGVDQLVNAIGSASKFIGNQSAPFAIASALDIPRICELDTDPAPFYMGEEKYSQNIKWFLNDQVNNL